MGGYLVNFSVYIFAMVGFLFIAVMVYNKTGLNPKKSKKNGGMLIEDSLNLTPRKTLHVVNVGGEKFLIAADIERTEFLAKLDNKENTTVKLAGLNNKIQLASKEKSNVTPLFAEKKEQEKPLVQGNVALKPAYTTTCLSRVKSINMKKPPIMREILRKLEV